MKLVCVQNTFEFLNTSAVLQNVVAWLLTLLLLMTIVNLKRFSLVLSEARTKTQCHLNFFNEFKRMITVINFEELCSENHVFTEKLSVLLVCSGQSDFRIVQ